MNVYSDYDQILKVAECGFSMGPVIREEKKHLAEMVELSRSTIGRFGLAESELIDIEGACFHKLWQSVHDDAMNRLRDETGPGAGGHGETALPQRGSLEGPDSMAFA